MKKFVLIVMTLALVLALSACACKHENILEGDCVTPKTCADCSEVLEAAPGHSWAEATCAAPKTCSSCGLTEGEALEHVWVEATTEAPKTCTGCGLTEGEKIITDARFTTANNEQLFGTWKAELSEYVPEYDMEMSMDIQMEFLNDGTLKMGIEIKNPEELMKAIIAISIEATYAEMEAAGYDMAAADEAFVATYGMDVETYMKEILSAMDLNELLGVMDAMSMVYYAEGDQLYSGVSWNMEMTSEEFKIEDGVLYLYGDGTTDPVPYYPVEETQE